MVHLTRMGFVVLTAAFVLGGATTSLFGPLLVTFSERFHLSTAGAGRILAVYFGGGVLGVLPGWVGVRRFSGRAVLNAALMTMAFGAALVSLASHWILAEVGAGVLGVGFGASGITLNTLLTRTAVEVRAHMLSVGNAGFGVGAVVTPLALIGVHPIHYALLVSILGIASLALALTTRGVVAPPHRDETRGTTHLDTGRRRRLIGLFIGGYVLYESVESGASGWMASQLHGTGYGDRTAILVTAGFWAGLALARAFGGALHRRFQAPALVIGSLVLATVGALGVRVHVLAPVAYPFLGLVIASIYPMGLMWFSTLSPHDSDATSAIILSAMAGSVIGPALIDLLVARWGVGVVPLSVALFAALDGAVFSIALVKGSARTSP